MEKIVEKIYCEFIRKLFDIPNYKEIGSDREKKYVSNFIDLINKEFGVGSIGSQFIFNFTSFQFEYYSSQDHRLKNRIPTNWIYGSKSLGRWKNRLNEDLFHSKKYASDNNIKLSSIDIPKTSKGSISDIKPYEEIEKKKFFNTDMGFINCIDATTLYNSRSDMCTICVNSESCKRVLRKNYPRIYLERGLL